MPKDGGLKLKKINRIAVKSRKNRERMLAIPEEKLWVFKILCIK